MAHKPSKQKGETLQDRRLLVAEAISQTFEPHDNLVIDGVDDWVVDNNSIHRVVYCHSTKTKLSSMQRLVLVIEFHEHTSSVCFISFGGYKVQVPNRFKLGGDLVDRDSVKSNITKRRP